MSQLVEAFILGNSAILTNVCILPLYPGLVAFLAGNANNTQAQKATRWLGLLVLAGVVAVCPEAAHGSLAHAAVENGEPVSGEHNHESGGHDHGHCEYEIAHTHTVRLSCAPDELASHLEAGYAHVGMRMVASREPQLDWVQ